MVGGPSELNESVWARRNFVKKYANRTLRPAEVILLVRYREAFSGRFLELGCGAGRFAGYVIDLGGEVHGIDISAEMVAFCRRRYPSGRFEVGDLRDLSGHGDGAYDCVFAGYNLLDVLDDAERRAVLREVRRLLAPGGLFVMSAHNRAHLPHLHGPTHVAPTSDPVRLTARVALVPWLVYKHHRMRVYEREEERYALVNDDAHRYVLVHYYVTPADQARQLAEEGLELVEALDAEGRRVPDGDDAAGSSEIYYVARPA
jgi:SAM-dependent methyltransferase